MSAVTIGRFVLFGLAFSRALARPRAWGSPTIGEARRQIRIGWILWFPQLPGGKLKNNLEQAIINCYLYKFFDFVRLLFLLG